VATTWPRQRHRGETPDERLDRNWNELLQELRVAQTGVQILTGFLLTLPFSQRFGELDDLQRSVYLAVLSGSVLATGLLVAPVVFHRTLFRQGLRVFVVTYAHRCAQAGLATLALTIIGVVWFVFDVVADQPEAWVAAGAALLFFACLWVLVPALLPRFAPPEEEALEEHGVTEDTEEAGEAGEAGGAGEGSAGEDVPPTRTE
jgi:hypothetical protein